MNERRMRRWLEAEGHTPEEIEERIDREADAARTDPVKFCDDAVMSGLMLRALSLVDEAKQLGFNLTIERLPSKPLAMGNMHYHIEAWKLRKMAPVMYLSTSKPEEPPMTEIKVSEATNVQLEQAQAELARPESSEMAAMRMALQMVTAERDKLKDQYNDLIYQVSQKFKDETRHQTAKRYIASWEGRSVETSVAKGAAHD